MRRLLNVLLALVAAAPAAVGGGAGHPLPASAATTYSYWAPWFDDVSPGMQLDNIHIVNPNAASASITITLPGAPNLQGSVGPYGEGIFNWRPNQHIGGPLHIVSDQPVMVTQRVIYGLSFNEFPALAEASAGKSFWFPWYDRASPQVTIDNIHLVNPGSLPATVSIRLGAGLFSYTVAVPANGATYYSLPSGFIAGPLHVTSDQPILVSQRVVYNQSFNEVAGLADSAASKYTVFNWYDQASPGFNSDAVHVVNPSPSATANISVTFKGAVVTSFSLAPSTANWFSFPGQIGGALTLTSDVPILATQRVDYWGSFMESPGLTTPSTSTWFNWYDNATACMLQNNIHLFTGGHAFGTISIGSNGMSIPFDVRGEGYYSFPMWTIGGPVHIQASPGSDPVYAESRTVRCPPPPPPAPPPPVPMPVRLRVPGLGIYAGVESVGTDAMGDMGVPTSAYDAGWFNMMPRPGDNGDAVMTGHVNWYGVPCAVFCYLTSAWVGMDIFVDRADGSTVHFVVDNMNYYPASAPPDWLYVTVGSPQLTLITCAGEFVGGHYTDRYVVHSHIV